MSHEERCNRHAVLLDNVRKYDVHWWCTTFLQYLQEVPRHA
jgi:trehalose 6-phosphate synthase